jgi:hypothetical protein
MNKTNVLIALLLLLMCFSYAETGFVNQTFTIWADITDQGMFFGVSEVNITIVDPEQNLYMQGTMLTYDPGQYFFNFTPNATGDYYAYALFYNSSGGVVQSGSTTINVLSADSGQIVEDLNMLSTVFLTTFVLLFGLLLAAVGYFINNGILYFFAGTWYLGVIGLTLTNQIDIGNPYIGSTFFAALAILFIWQGVSTLKSNRKEIEDEE